MKAIKGMQMRDVFFNELYHYAKADPNILILSNDLGAASLDNFRQALPSQFINAGISEQNIISVAAGLALKGKKVFIYSIASFITLRCLEQIKIDLCCMNLPVVILGVGASYSYSFDGPTHHAIDDIAIMRALAGMKLYNPSDIHTTENLVRLALKTKQPLYIRMDKGSLPLLPEYKFNGNRGFSVIKELGRDLLILTTGTIIHQIVELVDSLNKNNIKCTLIDVFRLKPINSGLTEIIKDHKRTITIEEHTINGGLGTIVAEICMDKHVFKNTKRYAVNEEVLYNYGDRPLLLKMAGLDNAKLLKDILKWHKE